MDFKKITITPVFGKKSNIDYDGTGKIIIKLYHDHLECLIDYQYEGDIDSEDESLGRHYVIIHDLCYAKKEFISQFGLGYYNKKEIYFVRIGGVDIDISFNVKDAPTGKAILNDLKKWLLNEVGDDEIFELAKNQ